MISRIGLKFAMAAVAAVIASTGSVTNGFVVNSQPAKGRYDTSCNSIVVPGMWPIGLNFGKGEFKFYRSFDSFMNVFTDEDREAFPEVFNIPTGVFEVSMTKPLGIVFEEIEVGKGVYVKELVEGGMAERMGKIQPDDILVGVTAIKVVGAKYERRLIPARNFDFDTAVGAITSNDPKWQCDDVVLMFERPSEADRAATDKFMEFFEPPFESPWKQPQ
mmetsp:Transcript_17144/g.47477  ORF Transcript_17144/g.47477 Transcript_17144/m.47477 type:complete len:218 (-) Transcript_17144:209-862(-)|eukprot:CAMPEP_0198120022 /NCGR_PEP_ID=MMETSP1442-20131203/27718_1 /TAXON_ID= /ORGANISM="Craspedostauros australis, Strain CCMP3328" /LENGTH=217 /DNA_ID=CAMNT_0043778603 /DNA_START=66 /DNA_END=719 /DNA_ORIENTATION=+